MATPKKPWPHEANWARLDSITLAQEAAEILETLADDLDNVHQVRMVRQAVRNLNTIALKLTSVKTE